MKLEKGTMLSKPLFLEIKSVKNVSKPFQRVKDPDIDVESKELKIGPKKGQMYQLLCHDGIRFVKVVFLFTDYKQFLSRLFKANKFQLKEGLFVSHIDMQHTILVDSIDQIQCHYNDQRSERLTESTMDIKGLPVKKTSAP